MCARRCQITLVLSSLAICGLGSTAFAGVADCKKIEAPLDRLACYDKLTSSKPSVQPGRLATHDLTLAAASHRYEQQAKCTDVVHNAPLWCITLKLEALGA